MSAFLPLRDPNHPAREICLQSSRQLYTYNYTHVSPLALLERVPCKDEFSVKWMTKIAERIMVVLENRAELEIHDDFREFNFSLRRLYSQIVSDAETLVHGLSRLVSHALRFEPRAGSLPLPASQLDAFASLFRRIDLPPVAKDYRDDRAFATMRVAGPNPVMLQRFRGRDERLPLDDKVFALTVPNDTFDAALAEGRLFLADYSILDGAECGNYPHGQKYIDAPLALFVLDKTTKELVPVAIQCKQKPGQDNPIFTPADGYNWLIAKTIVEIADGNVHEAATHLGRTHMYMEPYVVSTYRQLAPNHPLAILLSPHFQGTLAINEQAWRNLIANKGAVDKLFGASINAARGLTAKSVQTARVSDMLLPKAFSDRGVADPEALPHYPYRDDGMLYWNVIKEWVSSYLGIYYQSPQDVLSDTELQNWIHELASPDGGRLTGMPNEGSFQTLDELIDIVTLVIFTCSVQHAAVNFPQYDLMSYTPVMPLASYRPAPTTKNGATEADYLAMMPPLDMAELQMELGYLLGTQNYTQLGCYPDCHFVDPMVAAALSRFQKQLEEIGKIIASRNATRRPYKFLAPAGIPQSINI
jgi:arachidonate 15-lipoxygenase